MLLTPEWVTPANMKGTIVKDNFVPTAQLCARQVRGGLQGGGDHG